MCHTGHATGGGGHLGVTVFATGGGGGGGGTPKKFYEKAIVFGVFHRSCQNAKNYQLFEKISTSGLRSLPRLRCALEIVLVQTEPDQNRPGPNRPRPKLP